MTKPSYLFKGKANRDDNEPLFTALLEKFHIEYSYGNPGDGYDLLVQRSPMELWEIKNPLQARSDRKLTEKETDKMKYCETAGIPYHVFEHVEDAAWHLNERNGG